MPSKRRLLEERRRAGHSAVETEKRVCFFFRRLTAEEELHAIASQLDRAVFGGGIFEEELTPLSSRRVAVCVVA